MSINVEGAKPTTGQATSKREPTAKRNSIVVAFLALVLSVGFALRLSVFSTEELGLDGCLSVGLALIPIRDMFAFNLRDVHPPLFYLALRPWLEFVGTNFVAAKLFPVAAGLLTIAVMYQIVKRVVGTAAGVVAALLLMASPAHIFLSPTVRDFAPGLLLSLLSWLILLRLVTEETTGRRSRFLAIALAIATGAAALTWYFHALHLGLQTAYVLLSRPRRWRLAGGALIAGLLLAVPWLAVALTPLFGKMLGGITVSGEAPKLITTDAFLREAANSLVGASGIPWEATLGYWAVLLLIGVLWSLLIGHRTRALLPFSGAILGLAIAFLVSGLWVHTTFLIRYLLVPLPFVIFGQTALIQGKKTLRSKAAIACCLLLLVPAGFSYAAASSLPPIPYKQDAASLFLEPQIEAGDAIVFTDIARLGFYHLRNANPAPSFTVRYAGSAFLEDAVPARARALAPTLTPYKRVWLVDNESEKAELEGALRDELGKTREERLMFRTDPNLAVLRYRAPVLVPKSLRFGEVIDLVGYEIYGAGAELRARESMTVNLLLLPKTAMTKDYVVSVQLLDESGQLAAQSDGAAKNGRMTTSAWQPGEARVDTRTITLPSNAGRYALGLALYELPSVKRLPVAGTAADMAMLESITVDTAQ